MARKRVNTGFIIPTVSVAALVGAGTFYLYHHRHAENPAVYRQEAEKAVQVRDFRLAAEKYKIAAGMLQDAALHNMAGEMFLKSITPGSDNLSQAAAEFKEAEQIKPDSADAWKGLLETSSQQIDYAERHLNITDVRKSLPQFIMNATEASQHLSKLDPTDINALASGPELLIRAWILNLPLPPSSDPAVSLLTSDQRAGQAIIDLTKLMDDHPENEFIPYWIARGKINQAVRDLNGDHPEDAPTLFAEAAGQFDASIARRPTVIVLYLKKAMILEQLEGADPSGTTAQDYRTRLHDTLQAAQNLADPKDPQSFLEAKRQWATVLASTDQAGAEQVYRELIKRFPDDIYIRLNLARLLKNDASRRDDALKVLEEIPALPGPTVVTQLQRDDWERSVALSKLVRADIETDQLATAPAGAARDRLASDIHTCIQGANSMFNDQVILLRVRGRFELANGQVRESIKTLTRAYDMQSAEGVVDYALIRYTANAYRTGNQIGKAIELIEQAMQKNTLVKNSPEVQNTMAELNLDNHDYTKARPYVEWLAIRYPSDPRIIDLQIKVLGPDADLKATKPLFDKLPESKPDEINSKYQVAVRIRDMGDAVRLLDIRHAAAPDDVQVTMALSRTLAEAGKLDDAKKLAAELVAKHPDDQSIRLFGDSISGEASHRQLMRGEGNIINDIKDPVLKHEKLAEWYAEQDLIDDQLKELRAAADAASGTNDQATRKQLLNEIFMMDLDAKNFTDADALMPQLVELDADDAHGLMLKCRLALSRQDIPAALTYGRQVVGEFGNFSASYEIYGEALRASGQLDAACQQFVQALALTNTNVEARRNLIVCSIEEGKLEDAKSYITQARAQYPDDAAYREMQAQFEIKYGNPELVLNDMNQAIHTHPNEQRNYLITADVLAAAMRARAGKGDASGAAEYLKKTKELFQNAVKKWPDNLRFASGLAQVLQQDNDLPGAEKVLQTISDRPRWKDQPTPLVLLGKVYVTAGKYDLAETTLNRALAADPKSVDAHIVLADCRIMQKRYEDALAVLDPMTSSFPGRAKYTELLLAMGRGPQAQVELKDALRADPTNVQLINLQLHVYDALGQWDTGLHAANEALLNDHSNVRAYYWRGKFEASGPTPDYDLALSDLGHFRDAVPTDLEGRAMLAQVMAAKGDSEGAIHELEIAEKFSPQDRNIRLLLLRYLLGTTPPRTNDADRLLSQTVSLPAFANDPDFLSKGALIWAQKGEADKARDAMTRALTNAGDKRGSLVYDYFNMLIALKDWSQLVKESETYVHNQNTNWFVFNDRAVAESFLGDKTAAIADFQIALDRSGVEASAANPTQIINSMTQCLGLAKTMDIILPRAQNSLAWKMVAIDICSASGDVAGGMKLADAALASAGSLKPADQARLYRLASALYIRANPPAIDKAADLYKKMLVVNPENVDALNDMAYVLSDMTKPPNLKEALTYSQRAYDITQKTQQLNPQINDTQGWILIQSGRYSEGVDVLHQTIDQSNFPEAHYHLGYGYIKWEHPEDGMRELQAASDIIDKQTALHMAVDPTLKGKIDAAHAEALKVISDKIKVQ